MIELRLTRVLCLSNDRKLGKQIRHFDKWMEKTKFETVQFVDETLFRFEVGNVLTKLDESRKDSDGDLNACSKLSR